MTLDGGCVFDDFHHGWFAASIEHLANHHDNKNTSNRYLFLETILIVIGDKEFLILPLPEFNRPPSTGSRWGLLLQMSSSLRFKAFITFAGTNTVEHAVNQKEKLMIWFNSSPNLDVFCIRTNLVFGVRQLLRWYVEAKIHQFQRIPFCLLQFYNLVAVEAFPMRTIRYSHLFHFEPSDGFVAVDFSYENLSAHQQSSFVAAQEFESNEESNKVLNSKQIQIPNWPP